MGNEMRPTISDKNKLPPPGWYPKADQVEGYWDGGAWTGKTRKRKRRKPARAFEARPVKKEEPRRSLSVAAPAAPPGLKRTARGPIDAWTTLSIFEDGTFTTSRGLMGSQSSPDRLVAFDHDADSMRRKSAAGRGVAFLATGGISALASNNRGVLYVTVTGEATGTRTFTTRNPTGVQLTSVRSLKAAGDLILAQAGRDAPAPASASVPSVAVQLQQLADLHASGALDDLEFTAAKARLLAS